MNSPVLVPLPNDKWELYEDWKCSYNNSKYVVSKGFVTDGASIPKLLWFCYGAPMEYPYSFSATLHDYLYTAGHKQDSDPKCQLRKEADIAFRDYSIELGANKIVTWIEYWAIRLFGGSHWNEED